MKSLNRPKLYRAINYILLELGIKPSYKGYFYIREAVVLFIESLDPDVDYASVDIKEIIPKALYIDIGKRLSITIENVEKSIRVAINNMWQTADAGKVITILGHKYTFPKQKHTNTQIIYTVFQYAIDYIEFEEERTFSPEAFNNILFCKGCEKLLGHFSSCDGNCDTCPKKVK